MQFLRRRVRLGPHCSGRNGRGLTKLLFFIVVFLAMHRGFGQTSGSRGPTPGASPAERDARPNIVLIFTDDMGYGDLARYGHPTIRTPRLDRMAQEGQRFTQFYVSSPACTASRYGLLTGRLPVRSGFRWVLGPDSPYGLHPDEYTLANGLRDSGYATACYGKWHLGHHEESMPLQQGFEEYFGVPYSNDMIPPRFPDLPMIEGNGTVAVNPDQSGLTAEFTRRSIEFIRENRDRPFFVYLPYTMPHVPLYPGEAFAGQSPRGLYGDVIEEIDWSVGEILDELRRLDLAERTLVIFTSDNGPWIIKGEEGGSAGLLRDGKGSTWEGGVRVPFIAWWPGAVPANHVNTQVASAMDLYVTLLRLAGVEPPADRIIDGQDITPLLLEGDAEQARRPLFFYGSEEHLYAVRSGPWKLHIRQYSQTGEEYFDGRTPLLFHLERDPSEQYDLAGEHPEIVQRLLGLIDEHEAELGSNPSLWTDEQIERRLSSGNAGDLRSNR